MASCTTAYWDAKSTTPRVKLTVTQSSETGNTATLSWTLQYIASYAVSTSVTHACTAKVNGTTVHSSSYSIGGKTGTYTIASGSITVSKGTAAKAVAFSCSMDFSGITWSGTYTGSNKTASGSITISACQTYKITYNANGGTGAPSSQTKFHGTAITISTTNPTRSGYAFQGWATTASGSVAYASGATYSSNAALTLYAVWKANSYTVTYNANGGTGAPSSQTKTHGTALTLSTTKPTRTNYNFLGWGTAASSVSVAYAAGASYTANASVTLFAVWELASEKPRITNLSISRCDASGNALETGTCARVQFTWACDNAVSSIKIAWESALTSETSTTVSASGTSGSVNTVVGGSTLNADSPYSFEITVTDSKGYSVVFETLPGTSYVIDFLAGGKGAAIGKAAELEGIFEVALKTRFTGGLAPAVLEPETNLDNVRTPGTYIGENLSSYNYVNCPTSSGTFSLEVDAMGNATDMQIKQRFTYCSKYDLRAWERIYYGSTWGPWFAVYSFKGVSMWAGALYMTSGHAPNLSPPVSNQNTGILLVFCPYVDGVATEDEFICKFVSKTQIENAPGAKYNFHLVSSNFAKIGMKQLTIYDSQIIGSDINDDSGTANGVTYNNKYWVLRRVLGV